MTTIANGIIASDRSLADRSLVLSHLLDISQGYFTYSGSLTIPPYSTYSRNRNQHF